jgi:hypothetical protein
LPRLGQENMACSLPSSRMSYGNHQATRVRGPICDSIPTMSLPYLLEPASRESGVSGRADATVGLDRTTIPSCQPPSAVRSCSPTLCLFTNFGVQWTEVGRDPFRARYASKQHLEERPYEHTLHEAFEMPSSDLGSTDDPVTPSPSQMGRVVAASTQLWQ